MKDGKQFNHDSKKEKDDNVLSLTPYGEQPAIVSIDFGPDW